MIEPILKPKDRKRVKPPAVTIMPDLREICSPTPAGKREYRRRTLEMRTRQKELCCICGKWMVEHDTTFEHQDGRGMNSSHRDDRLAIDGNAYNGAAHSGCNREKGSKRTAYVTKVTLDTLKE